MQDFEKLGAFYLGKEFDLAAGEATENLVLYDAKDLTTHAMIVGMTGSGKTGLALAMLEEAAIDGIPAILIDPKGDLGNLLLQFPGLQPAEFRPWVDEAEAARQGLAPDAFAAKIAETWRNGLARWGQDGARIQRLKDAVELAVYTPGYSGGRPLQALRSFDAPPAATAQDQSALRDRVLIAVSGLLGLLGLDADPVQSRDHILLSTIFERAWREGQGLDLPVVIQEIQKPPFERIGVFDLESFYPAKDRLRLAMSLNNLLASPGFSAWMEGEALDVQRLLYSPSGKPRISVLYLAHLSDAERMFFVTLLLNEVLAWTRAQSGTDSLRALLYMDEIFGFFPPTENPPSKRPMLTLLKQARAFGLGVVLSTQNPVDLDYKGLSNCGTWFIGRLQTERDKLRVIEGLEGAAAGAAGFDRAQTEQTLAGLSNRVFFMHNVHDERPTLFQTRWVLSYMRGPLTLPQIQKLLTATPAAPAAAIFSDAATLPASVSIGQRPILPPGLDEAFARPRSGGVARAYRPQAYGIVKLHFVNATTQTDVWTTRAVFAPLSDDGTRPLWEQAVTHADARALFDAAPAQGATFEPLPSGAANVKNADAWRKSLAAHAYQCETLTLMQCLELKLTSRLAETEGDFRARIAQAQREQRDLVAAKLKAKYAPKLQALGDQVRRAQEGVEREKAQAGQQKMNTVLSVGATLLGAFIGRSVGVGTVGRATTAARSASRIGKEDADVQRANTKFETLQQRLAQLEAEFQRETAALADAVDPISVDLHPAQIRPRKSDVVVAAAGINWIAVN